VLRTDLTIDEDMLLVNDSLCMNKERYASTSRMNQRPAWLTPSWPIVLTEHRRQTRNNDVALKLRTARSGFTSGLLQRQIGDGSHADGDQWPMLHAMMADGVALSARPKEGSGKHVPHVDMF